MRTIDAELTTAQASYSLRPATPTLHIAGVNRSANLAYYTYRERALQSVVSRVWLNNTTGSLNTFSSLGATVDIARGAQVGGVDYLAALPRLWVDRITFEKRWYILECVGLWGKLKRWRAPATYTWTSTDLNTIIDDFFSLVGGLTRETAIPAYTRSFTLNQGDPGHIALRELVSRSGDTPYAGLAGNVKFKRIGSDTTSVYTYGWNTDHPLSDLTYSPGLARYNQVLVKGAIDPGTGDPYYDTANDAEQQAWVGIRQLVIYDTTLTSTLACRTAARAELALQLALAGRAQPKCLPVHGLEVLDLCTIATTPWGGTGYTVRCGGYTEEHRPRHHYQTWYPSTYDPGLGL